MSCVSRGNEYVQSSQPWSLAKQSDDASRQALDRVLASLVRQLARQSVLLAPFMPQKAQALWAQLGAPDSVHAQRFADLAVLDATGWRVKKGDALFPKEKSAS
jgi:methionyl-tRNA synthetase